MNLKKINKRGFSLIEILLSMAIFSIIIGGVVLFSTRTIESHTKSEAMQNAIDNSRYALDSLNKRIRTSRSLKGTAYPSGGDSIFFIDNNENIKYCYQFYSSGTINKLRVKRADSSSSATDCSGIADNWVDVVGSDSSKVKITGKFYIKETDTSTSGSEKRGMATTSISLSFNSSGTVAESDSMKIQSTISLRDYGY